MTFLITKHTRTTEPPTQDSEGVIVESRFDAERLIEQHNIPARVVLDLVAFGGVITLGGGSTLEVRRLV